LAQGSQLQLSHFSAKDGLSQSNITCILQDRRGFLWFGTFNGLNRFDGYSFQSFHYQPGSSNSLSHNYISSLIEDRNGVIWIGASGGLNRYHPDKDQFYSYLNRANDQHSLSDNLVVSLLEDRSGAIWVGTRNGGLNRFDKQKNIFTRFLHNPADDFSLSSNTIVALFEDSAGNIWVTHLNGAVDILRDSKKIHSQKIAAAAITKIVETKDKTVWAATQGDGVYQLQYRQNQLNVVSHYRAEPFGKRQLSGNTILSLMLDRSNRLWIGAENKGIDIFDLTRNAIRNHSHTPFISSSLSHNSIWDIYEDRSENIWIGTYANGIHLLTPKRLNVRHYKNNPNDDKALSHNIVNSILEDEDENIWIATDGGGLNLFIREQDDFKHYTSKNTNIHTNVIVCLANDKKNRLWAGTWTKGLFLFDKKTKRFRQFSKENSGLGSNRILHILNDNNGSLWLSTYDGGLTHFNTQTFKATVYNKQNSGLKDNYVRTSFKDFDGNLWIGSDTGVEVLHIDQNKFTRYMHNKNEINSLSQGFVHSIIQMKDSSIWIGTDGGLNRFDPEIDGFVHYTEKDGLPHNAIKNIVLTKNETLWISANKGISHFNPRTTEFLNYDVSDGLQGNEFNIRSGMVAQNGEIYFGGNNGFNVIRPGEKYNNVIIPPVYITDLKILNRSVMIGGEDSILSSHISHTKEIELSYHQNVISFEFVALNYVSPEKNEYAHILEGFDDDWNYIGSKRTATYTNLDPGVYLFKVKASNNDGVWNERGATLKVVVTPPFWKTGWAYLIAAMVAIGTAGFVANHFVGRQKMRNKLMVEHLELEKMYEMDQMKTQFFNNVAHEFYSPLTLILSPLQNLIDEVKNQKKLSKSLTTILHNAQRLKRMTGQLKDFQRLEQSDLKLSLSRGNIVRFTKRIVNSFQDYAENRQIQLNFSSNKEKSIEWFDQDKLDKIIYNLLSNAFKFTPDKGKVTVSVQIVENPIIAKAESEVYKSKRLLELEVEDTGIGIPKDKMDHIFKRFYQVKNIQGKAYDGSGVGLSFIQELVHLYGGEITVKSSKGIGSTFTIVIPLDEHYMEEHQLVESFDLSSDILIEPNYQAETDDEKENIPQLSSMNIPLILIVEDDEELRNFLEASLKNKYRTLVAENGKVGLEKATETIPDLIISDVKMPSKDGNELCFQLRHDEKTSHIPVILLTAFSSAKDKIDGLQKGADVYLTKPVNLYELEAHITNLLQSRRRLRAKYSNATVKEKQTVQLSALDEQFMNKIKKRIDEQMANSKFNADSLSKEVGMSRMQLYRKIRGLTDQTVHEFIRHLRLEKATQLLQDKQKTITEVAYDVGFNDLTYFARCFKKKYHKSPSEYISANR
jgi:ligand-binding sensor domain-containing protein/signal transduction histidine kinase/DNA-binding response OmpR family regulator